MERKWIVESNVLRTGLFIELKNVPSGWITGPTSGRTVELEKVSLDQWSTGQLKFWPNPDHWAKPD